MSEQSYNPQTVFRVALTEIGRTLERGAETHDPSDWRRHSFDHHLDHAAGHIEQYLSGDDSEDHIAHAATRLLMALESP